MARVDGFQTASHYNSQILVRAFEKNNAQIERLTTLFRTAGMVVSTVYFFPWTLVGVILDAKAGSTVKSIPSLNDEVDPLARELERRDRAISNLARSALGVGCLVASAADAGGVAGTLAGFLAPLVAMNYGIRAYDYFSNCFMPSLPSLWVEELPDQLETEEDPVFNLSATQYNIQYTYRVEVPITIEPSDEETTVRVSTTLPEDEDLCGTPFVREDSVAEIQLSDSVDEKVAEKATSEKTDVLEDVVATESESTEEVQTLTVQEFLELLFSAAVKEERAKTESK